MTANNLWERSEHPETPLEYTVAFSRVLALFVILAIFAVIVAAVAAVGSVLVFAESAYELPLWAEIFRRIVGVVLIVLALTAFGIWFAG